MSTTVAGLDVTKMEVTEEDLHRLYSWIDDIPLSRPKRHFTRDFSDGVLMAEVMRYYFPKLVQMHNYSSANSTRQKIYNWETLNRKVMQRIGIEVPQAHLEAIVNCEPRAIESLLKLARVQILKRQAMPTARSPRSATPEGGSIHGEHGEDANNRHTIGSSGRTKKGTTSRSRRISHIPRAPSQLSMTPPPVASNLRRPKSSFDVCSSNEKDIMIKELQETNELLLAKISKLEQLLNLKDRKIESLVAKLQAANNIYSSSPSP